jgi:two-component sensor histidine kinase
VSVNWDKSSDERGAAKVTIVWREHGGPPVAAPARTSFGSSLIRDLIPHELGGTVDLAFEPDGVSCRIEVPLGRA